MNVNEGPVEPRGAGWDCGWEVGLGREGESGG